ASPHAAPSKSVSSTSRAFDWQFVPSASRKSRPVHASPPARSSPAILRGGMIGWLTIFAQVFCLIAPGQSSCFEVELNESLKPFRAFGSLTGGVFPLFHRSPAPAGALL